MNKFKLFIPILAFFVVFVNYRVVAKQNFDYSIYTPETIQTNAANLDLTSPSKILFIMDFSNSMNENLGSKTKLQAALDTLAFILPKIPDTVQTGLRVYGYKVGFTYLQGCMASKMAVPFASHNADNILGALYKTSAVGWTPITYSLKQAVNVDFAGVKGKKHIVLLTDGGENCDESPCTYAIELMKTHDDISIDVIALDINDAEANSQLRCAAVATRGKFYTANSQKQLADSLFESFNIDKNVKGTIKLNEGQ